MVCWTVGKIRKKIIVAVYIIPDYPGSCERTHTQEVLYFQTEKVLWFNEPEGTHLVPDWQTKWEWLPYWILCTSRRYFTGVRKQVEINGVMPTTGISSFAPHRYFICIVTLVLCKKNAIPRILFIDDSTEKILRAEWSPSVRCQINHWNLTYCFR